MVGSTKKRQQRMSDFTSQQTNKTKLWRTGFLLAMSAFVFGLAGYSLFCHSTPNDGIGRYQMRVTDNGVIVVMDTVSGAITKVDRVEDYSSYHTRPAMPTR
jgi:hypothetical protein